MAKLLVNCIITPDGTKLISHNRHDAVCHVDANGETYMNDGGTDYSRRSLNIIPYIEKLVYDDEPFEIIREFVEWGYFGKQANEKLHWIKLKDMSDKHIQAILDQSIYDEYEIRKLFVREIEYRNENNLIIKDKQ